MASSKFVLEREEIDTIRNALLIGLASYGEVERLAEARQTREACGREVPEDLRVIHPTGSPTTVSEFAEALRALEYARSTA